MQCQPTLFLLCQPQWQMPQLFAMGKSQSSLFFGWCWVRCLGGDNCANRAVSVIVLLLFGEYIALLNLDVCHYYRFHSLVIDVTMALDTLSLPVLEPLTPTRLQDVTVLALSCLYAGEWISCLFFGALSRSCFCSAWLPAPSRFSPQVTFYFSWIWKLCSILHGMVTGFIWKLL